MAKRVRISVDGGTTYRTLPGSTAELSSEAGDINDTIFGQDFASTQTGLIGWTIQSNGLYKGFAGYVAKIYKSGTPTALNDEPMSLVSGKTYQVTDTAKRCFDRNTAITFEDNGSPVSANDIAEIDWLFGRVTFATGYTVTGPVTVTGNYLPLTQVARANAFTLTQTANPIDDTDFETAQGNQGHRTFIYGLKTVSLDLTGIYASSNAYRALLASRSELVIEINPDGNAKSRARGFFKPMSTGQSGEVGDQEAETVTFNLSVPDQENVPTPFKWLHASDTTLSQAIRDALNAWEDNQIIDVQYLPDGTNGVEGSAVITDLSLAGGLEVMNEYTVNLQGVGELTAVP